MTGILACGSASKVSCAHRFNTCRRTAETGTNVLGFNRNAASAAADVGIMLPSTWVGAGLGFASLLWSCWPILTAMLLSYAILTHKVKIWFARRWGG
jgi:hypothetical protein